MRLLAVMAVLLLAGCSGSGDDGKEAAPEEIASSTAPPATLAESCPEMEAAMPEDPLPSPDEAQAVVDHLNGIREAGDTETQNAVDFLISAFEMWAADPAQGTESADAFGAVTSAAQTVADRCEAVGSSSFQ